MFSQVYLKMQLQMTRDVHEPISGDHLHTIVSHVTSAAVVNLLSKH